MSKEIEKKSPVEQPRLVAPLPCPFCGCEHVRVLECVRLSVSCDNCRAIGPASTTENDAVTKWNSHANATRDLAEALRKAVVWGEAASTHILYREKINWRYLEEARETLNAHSRHNAIGEARADNATSPKPPTQ